MLFGYLSLPLLLTIMKYLSTNKEDEEDEEGEEATNWLGAEMGGNKSWNEIISKHCNIIDSNDYLAEYRFRRPSACRVEARNQQHY